MAASLHYCRLSSVHRLWQARLIAGCRVELLYTVAEAYAGLWRRMREEGGERQRRTSPPFGCAATSSGPYHTGTRSVGLAGTTQYCSRALFEDGQCVKQRWQRKPVLTNPESLQAAAAAELGWKDLQRTSPQTARVHDGGNGVQEFSAAKNEAAVEHEKSARELLRRPTMDKLNVKW
eukprot:1263586-Rhodomonas_salina.2